MREKRYVVPRHPKIEGLLGNASIYPEWTSALGTLLRLCENHPVGLTKEEAVTELCRLGMGRPSASNLWDTLGHCRLLKPAQAIKNEEEARALADRRLLQLITTPRGFPPP